MPVTSTLGITPPGGMAAVTVPPSQPLRLPARGPLFQPPVVPEAARSEPLPLGTRPKSSPGVRQAMPTLHDEDPLSYDLQEASRPQQRIQLPDELDDELDLGALRNPRMPAPLAALAHAAAFDDEETPGTAPYHLVEEARSPATSAYVAGSLRQPPPVSSAPNTIHGLSEDAQDTLDEGGDFVTSARPTLMGHQPLPTDPLQRALREMRDKFALGDFSGSLKAAEAVLATDAAHGEAQRYADTCRQRLRAMYEAKLGSLSRVPRVALPPDQVRWLSLDHRAGFILSCVDGYSAIEEILDVSGMSALDALRILCDLLQQKVIAVA
ncbi:MAG: hypothetical protein EOO75_19205 [Myxococcales bacterium]|nr:MAG: hypothetical protein EOO75_19205 [Myxococcales bacterium]